MSILQGAQNGVNPSLYLCGGGSCWGHRFTCEKALKGKVPRKIRTEKDKKKQKNIKIVFWKSPEGKGTEKDEKKQKNIKIVLCEQSPKGKDTEKDNI